MSRSLRRALVAKSSAGAVLAVAAVAAVPASAFALNPFYTPPAELPAANGDLVKTQPMSLGAPRGGTKVTRIMYRSEDTAGQPVAVTGALLEPTARWGGSGARPLVTYAEGTQGQGDECAPSLGLQSPIGASNGSINVGYEVPNIYGLLDRGFAVVVTDYVGLGTPGRLHTYVNRLDQGHAVLDAARAALQVEGTTVTAESPVGAYGYSQGGGAAASAAELAPSYAPDVNLKAAFAGAPPADLNAVMRTADGTTLTAVIGFAINGFVETYPELKTILDRETNASGKSVLRNISGMCIGDAAIAYAFQKTSKWTTSGKTVSQIVAANPEAKAIVDAQKIGTLKPEVPVRVLTGTQDDIVTHSQVKQLAKDWCALGANVSYVPVIQYIPTFGTAVNHLEPSLAQGGASQKWLADRLAGKSVTSNCASVPRLP